MGKLVVGALQKAYGSVDMKASASVVAIGKPQLVANPYPNSGVPVNSTGVQCPLGGTEAEDRILNHKGQIYKDS